MSVYRLGISTVTRVPAIAVSTAVTTCGQHRLHERPQAVAKDDDRNPATFKVLLLTHVFVGCEQHVKPGLFRDTQ